VRAVAALLAAGLVAVIGMIAPAVSLAATANRVLQYQGYRLTVPRGWPVIRLPGDPSACVRFDRHAVYLGAPATAQRCPAQAAGRTEAILVAPLGAGAAASPLPSPTTVGASPGEGSQTRIVDRAAGVVVTATWGRNPRVIERALGLRSLPAAISRLPVAVATRETAAIRRARAAVTGVTPAAVALPGAVYTGLGFDACSTPSAAQMAAWGASPYRAAGVYIGGANLACAQANLTAAWVTEQAAAGWHLVPIYVGLQAPSNSCGCASISPLAAAAQGTAAAQDAVAHAQAIGLGTGNPIYYDMEAYTPGLDTTTVLAFLGAWTEQLHASGYLSGVYSSANSGIQDLVAQVGTIYAEPDDIWVADWNGIQSSVDASVPSTDWDLDQRLHQYSGAHDETYGATTINIDGDYVDAATAAPGVGATVSSGAHAAPPPTLSVSPTPGGAVTLQPSWSGVAGVASWEVLGGPTSTSLTPVTGAVSAASTAPITVSSAYPYFAVQALGAAGQMLAGSAPVATPAHVAIFGQSAFVSPTGVGGIPVGCFGATVCRLITRITLGRRTLVTTGRERVSAGGGLVYFALAPAAQSQLARALHHRLAVTVAVSDASGMSASRPLNLVGFQTTGAAPVRSITPSPELQIIGATEFVSNGWVGGILAGCFAGAPCSTAATLTAGGTVIAHSSRQTLGVNELGYIQFTLTAAGHRLLASAPGNQLAVRLTLGAVTATGGAASASGGGAGASGGATSAYTSSARIALVGF
jgi:hypothetical protein